MGKVYGVVLAGGIGSRMGNAEKPKQFLEIGSRPVIIHTLEKFVLHPGFDEVLVLSPKAWVSYTRDIIRKYIPSASRIPVLEGGVTRNETIMNAIRYIEEQGDLDEDTIIVTHDHEEAISLANRVRLTMKAFRIYPTESICIRARLLSLSMRKS